MSRRLPLMILIALFLAVNVWAVYTYVTAPFPGANDFYQRWYGARAYWVDHIDSYSPVVARQVELYLYGHPYDPDPALDEYPGDFLYPFPMAIVLAPLTPLPYALASAIWIVLTAALIACAFVAMADLFNWRLPVGLLIGGMVWAVSFYPAVRGIFLGQPGTAAVCLHLLTIWALVKGRDRLAGGLLAITIYKPQIGFLIIPFLVLWALRYRRWRFLASFALGSAILVGLSFLLLSSWLGEWLAQAAQYVGYTRIGSPVWVITTIYFPFLGHTGELIISAILVIGVLWAWWLVVGKGDSSSFVWAAALSLSVTHLVAIRTATPHYVVYFIVIVFCFREIGRSSRRWGVWLVALAMIGLSAGLWILFLSTLQNRFEHPINYLPLPIGSLVVLWLTRERWRRAFPAPLPESAAVSTFTESPQPGSVP